MTATIGYYVHIETGAVVRAARLPDRDEEMDDSWLEKFYDFMGEIPWEGDSEGVCFWDVSPDEEQTVVEQDRWIVRTEGDMFLVETNDRVRETVQTTGGDVMRVEICWCNSTDSILQTVIYDPNSQ